MLFELFQFASSFLLLCLSDPSHLGGNVEIISNTKTKNKIFAKSWSDILCSSPSPPFLFLWLPTPLDLVRWNGQMRKKFPGKEKNNCTYLSLAEDEVGCKKIEKNEKQKKHCHHSLFPFTHLSMFVREKQVFVSCSGKVLEPFLALKVSVTRNLRVLPSVLSADSSSNVNQFWDVWSKIWSL